MKILAIDGGGIRGLVALTIIEKLELLNHKPITQQYDLIIGTSTGGIIACGYGCGYSTTELIDFYLDNSDEIFSSSFLWKLKSGFGIFNSKYDGKGLKDCLIKYFGDKKLKDSIIPIITTSYNTIKNDVEIFKSENETNYTMVDASMATSAAPTYFPPYIIGENQYIDGGICMGSPLIVALGEGADEKVPYEVISIGTGYNVTLPFDTRGWGAREYLLNKGASPLNDFSLTGQKQVNKYLSSRLEFKYYDIMLKENIKMDESNPEKLIDLVKYCRQQPL